MMTIYVDEIREYPRGKFCHMWTDGDESSLHEFAGRLGLSRNWIHFSHGLIGDFPHYDLTPSKRMLAIKYGAMVKPLKEWVQQRLQSKSTIDKT